MADLLLEKETIFAEDIEPILGVSAQNQHKDEDKTNNEATNEGVTVAD